MKVIDNCLPKDNFNTLQTFLMGDLINWNYKNTIDYDNKSGKDIFQFIHMFYINTITESASPYFETLNPIIGILKPSLLARIKANLLTKTPSIIENEFHVDINLESQENLKLFTTSIFYVNTNNGYTEFEDGTKIESVENRLVTFPTNMKHRGTSCTDKNTRVVINFNYIK
tara:strand:- start:1120 stop:1632 length:513 start_codon:yes stop_codon:yes gene_type:complete